MPFASMRLGWIAARLLLLMFRCLVYRAILPGVSLVKGSPRRTLVMPLNLSSLGFLVG
jgi:hypothetical protein